MQKDLLIKKALGNLLSKAHALEGLDSLACEGLDVEFKEQYGITINEAKAGLKVLSDTLLSSKKN